MTADSTWAVQTAVFATLAGNAALVGLLPDGSLGVHDAVPPDAAFPYIVLGETAAKPLDTQTAGGYDITLSLHAYSRANGFHELRTVMAAVHDALHHAPLPVSGQTTVLCDVLSAQTQLEQDGLTRHGIMRLRIVTAPI